MSSEHSKAGVSTTARFELAADEETPAFECSLDNAPWSDCQATTDYEGLTEGQHSFRARAAGPLSGVGPVISRSWTVDLTDPVLTLDQVPASPTRAKSAEIRFGSGEAGHFECRLDSALESAFATCVSPHTVFALADGEHRLDVRAVDLAGNTDTKTVVWTVTTSPPAVTFGSVPARFSPSRDARVEFTSSRTVASAECRLDAGAWAACASPVEYSGLRDGPHDFAVKITDQAGNSATAGHSWDVDTVAPVARIEAGPSGETARTDADFGFGASEPAILFACSLDGGTFETCTSPKAITGLAAGEHELRVRATDRAGNTGPVVTRTWSVVAAQVPPEETIEPKVTFKRTVRVKRAGPVEVGRVACGTSPCAVTGTRGVRVKAGGRRFKVAVKLPKTLAAGLSAPIQAIIPGNARAALKGRRVSLKLTVEVSSGERSESVTRRISLRG